MSLPTCIKNQNAALSGGQAGRGEQHQLEDRFGANGHAGRISRSSRASASGSLASRAVASRLPRVDRSPIPVTAVSGRCLAYLVFTGCGP